MTHNLPSGAEHNHLIVCWWPKWRRIPSVIISNWILRPQLIRVIDSEWYKQIHVNISVQVSYGCLSLHGGKDQTDRESTINDFKNDVCSLLIATSVAARGLDVKDLVVVVNYDPPDHHEDYVHRVGRTGSCLPLLFASTLLYDPSWSCVLKGGWLTRSHRTAKLCLTADRKLRRGDVGWQVLTLHYLMITRS